MSVLLHPSNIYIDHGCKVAKDLYYHYFVNFNLDFLRVGGKVRSCIVYDLAKLYDRDWKFMIYTIIGEYL